MNASEVHAKFIADAAQSPVSLLDYGIAILIVVVLVGLMGWFLATPARSAQRKSDE